MKLKNHLETLGIFAFSLIVSTYATLGSHTSSFNPIKHWKVINHIPEAIYESIEKTNQTSYMGPRTREVYLIKQKKILKEEYNENLSRLEESFDLERAKLKQTHTTDIERLVQIYERK